MVDHARLAFVQNCIRTGAVFGKKKYPFRKRCLTRWLCLSTLDLRHLHESSLLAAVCLTFSVSFHLHVKRRYPGFFRYQWVVCCYDFCMSLSPPVVFVFAVESTTFYGVSFTISAFLLDLLTCTISDSRRLALGFSR